LIVQIFGTRFQVTLGDLRLSIGFSVDSIPEDKDSSS